MSGHTDYSLARARQLAGERAELREQLAGPLEQLRELEDPAEQERAAALALECYRTLVGQAAELRRQAIGRALRQVQAAQEAGELPAGSPWPEVGRRLNLRGHQAYKLWTNP